MRSRVTLVSLKQRWVNVGRLHFFVFIMKIYYLFLFFPPTCVTFVSSEFRKPFSLVVLLMNPFFPWNKMSHKILGKFRESFNYSIEQGPSLCLSDAVLEQFFWCPTIKPEQMTIKTFNSTNESVRCLYCAENVVMLGWGLCITYCTCIASRMSVWPLWHKEIDMPILGLQCRVHKAHTDVTQVVWHNAPTRK